RRGAVVAVPPAVGGAPAWAGAPPPAGGGAWSAISDRTVKANFSPVDARIILERVAAISVQSWNYKSQDASIRHIGPMAQDFHAAFGVGEDDTHISTVDADGVALASIQALYQLVQTREAELAAQRRRLAELEARLVAIEHLVVRQPCGLVADQIALGEAAER